MPDGRARKRVRGLDRLLHGIADGGPGGRETDSGLLRRFADGRDDRAFRELVCRHGPMVFRVCLRVLRREHDAEDAFQATFLVLARKAESVRKSDSIGSWLFGVAHRVAQKMRTASARRRSHERPAAPPEPAGPLAELTVREAQELLDDELARLPEKYRAPLVLCCLEGKTRDEAAKQLGWETSALKSRLERARELLRRRLARRGLTVPAVLLASLLGTVSTSTAAVRTELIDVTVRAAATVAAGATPEVSTQAAASAEGVMRAMRLNKIKTAVLPTLVAFVGAVVAAGALATTNADPPGVPSPDEQKTPRPDAPKPPARAADEKKESPEEKVKRLGLVSVSQSRTGITTKPTPQAPKPPVIHFFKGQKNEVRVAPGESALVELPRPATELAWEIPGYVPEAVGTSEDGPEFEYVLCQWDARVSSNLVFTMYRRPAKGEKGTPPPPFPVPVEEDTAEEKAEKRKLEEKIKELKLVHVFDGGAYLDTKPTARTPKPVIHFFKGQKNEVQLAPGRTVLIELSKPAREIAWEVQGYRPRSVPGLAAAGVMDGPEFDFVLCRWEKHGDVGFKMYRRPGPDPAQKEEPPKPSGEVPVVVSKPPGT